MKLVFQLAYKNLIGAGLRTWLNVAILSFCYVIIITFNGFIDGWNEQAKRDSVAWEYGKGHLLHKDYDPYDQFTLQDAHGELPDNSAVVPVLIQQASLYPAGRMVGIQLKGIEASQTILELPTQQLLGSDAQIPAIIGKRMASSLKAKVGDQILLRWRDKNGTFDASNITIVDIFDSNVGTIDNGQVWIPIENLWQMTGLTGEATMGIATAGFSPKNFDQWDFRSQEALLKELSDIIEMKKVGGFVMYGLLLAIALLAIFDTQVLSIFRRQKEIGTYISLGMTRWQVVKLFTLEGSMYSILATIIGSIYGIPLFIFMANQGIGMPAATGDMGVTIAERIYPVFGFWLIIGTILLVVASATIVSFLPARKIEKMDPVEALKGKLQ